jgi:hypothetical protein
MKLAAFLLLAAFSEPNANQAADGANEQPKTERLICKRIDASESRMASKRICKTAKQWKAEQRSDDGTLDRAVRGSD